MISKTDRRYFLKARNIADLSDFHKIHIGCVEVYQYRINNLLPKLHAEISCISSIRHLNINFSKVKLYIYRTRYDQDHGLARPCPSCMAAIKDLGIKHIYYTTNDGYGYEYVEGVA